MESAHAGINDAIDLYHAFKEENIEDTVELHDIEGQIASRFLCSGRNFVVEAPSSEQVLSLIKERIRGRKRKRKGEQIDDSLAICWGGGSVNRKELERMVGEAIEEDAKAVKENNQKMLRLETELLQNVIGKVKEAKNLIKSQLKDESTSKETCAPQVSDGNGSGTDVISSEGSQQDSKTSNVSSE